MIPAGKYVFCALSISFFARLGIACDLTGSYALHWEQTHGDQPRYDFEFDIVSAGEAPRALLEGVQAENATDCRMNSVAGRSRYMMPFSSEMYSALGWNRDHDYSKLNCYWSDLFFICHNPSKADVAFDCPAALGGETLSDEAELLCSVRKTVQETFSKKRVTFNKTKEYFGVAGYSGIFSLERKDK